MGRLTVAKSERQSALDNWILHFVDQCKLYFERSEPFRSFVKRPCQFSQWLKVTANYTTAVHSLRLNSLHFMLHDIKCVLMTSTRTCRGRVRRKKGHRCARKFFHEGDHEPPSVTVTTYGHWKYLGGVKKILGFITKFSAFRVNKSKVTGGTPPSLDTYEKGWK